MPWVRIDQNAMDHPKIGNLSDGAFRLWVQGLAHCQKHLTDGLIKDGAMRLLRAYSPKRRDALLEATLWEPHDLGVQIHDYLEWNDSRDHVTAARTFARERMAKLRGSSENVRANSKRTPREVPCVSVVKGSTTGLEGNGESPRGDSLTDRVRAFVEWYEDTYQRLEGVGYVSNGGKDYEAACKLLSKFTDAQARDAAFVWFGMDDDFATNGTKTIVKFASRASDCLKRAKAVSA